MQRLLNFIKKSNINLDTTYYFLEKPVLSIPMLISNENVLNPLCEWNVSGGNKVYGIDRNGMLLIDCWWEGIKTFEEKELFTNRDLAVKKCNKFNEKLLQEALNEKED
jgi:hypothetical protein